MTSPQDGARTVQELSESKWCQSAQCHGVLQYYESTAVLQQHYISNTVLLKYCRITVVVLQ